MAPLSALLLGWCALSGFVLGNDGGFMIETHRDYADKHHVNSVSALRKRQTIGSDGVIGSKIGQSLYWFGHWAVAEHKHLKLLIDTGSTDLILNPGLYEPSIHEKPYPHPFFSITYEGVNREGFGFQTINGTVHYDNATAAGLTVNEQAVGNVTSFKYFDVPQLPFPTQANGIIGFAGPPSSSFKPQANSWFFNLCDNGAISKPCRFALAFGTSGKGLTVVGQLAKNLFKGPLVSVKREKGTYGSSYTILGDVTVNDKIVFKDQNIIFDVGTDNIQAPISETKKIFDILGYQSVEQSQPPSAFAPGLTVKVLQGFFQCNKPPTIGFSFPAQSQLKKGQVSKNFNVPTDTGTWDVYDNGNNNCTSILGGTNALNSGSSTAWLLGQPWYTSHYVDFDITSQTVNIADLVDPASAGRD